MHVMVQLSFEAIPSLSSLLELEELSVDEYDHSLKNGDLSEVVVIRHDIIELNSSSLLDEAVLDDTRKHHSVRVVGHQYLKTSMIPCIP